MTHKINVAVLAPLRLRCPAPGQITLPWAIWAIVQPSDGQLPLLRLRTRLWQSRDELAGGGARGFFSIALGHREVSRT